MVQAEKPLGTRKAWRLFWAATLLIVRAETRSQD
jgi:hypothetical protein